MDIKTFLLLWGIIGFIQAIIMARYRFYDFQYDSMKVLILWFFAPIVFVFNVMVLGVATLFATIDYLTQRNP